MTNSKRKRWTIDETFALLKAWPVISKRGAQPNRGRLLLKGTDAFRQNNRTVENVYDKVKTMKKAFERHTDKKLNDAEAKELYENRSTMLKIFFRKAFDKENNDASNMVLDNTLPSSVHHNVVLHRSSQSDISAHCQQSRHSDTQNGNTNLDNTTTSCVSINTEDNFIQEIDHIIDCEGVDFNSSFENQLSPTDPDFSSDSDTEGSQKQTTYLEALCYTYKSLSRFYQD